MCKISLTNSNLVSFCSCRRQYDYKFNKGILPVENAKSYDNAIALKEALITVAMSHSEHLSAEDCIAQALLTLKSHVLEMQDEARLEAAIRAYVRRYYDPDSQDWEVVSGTPNAGVTVQMTPNVTYTTYLDYVVRNRKSGKTFVVVNKSSSVIGDDFMCRFFIDNDIRLQVIAAKQLLGCDVDGVIINAVTRPQHKIKVGETDEEYAERNNARKGKADLKRKVGESREEFVSRVVEDYSDDSLKRATIMFTEAQLNQAMSTVIAVAFDMMACKSFYPNTSECTKFGKCPYMDLCMRDGDLSQVSDQYTTKK